MTHLISPEDLMRYLDGELPTDERGRLEATLKGSTELQRELALFRAMQEDLHDLSYSLSPTHGVWDQVNRRLARPIGWVLFVVGIIISGSYGVYVYFTTPGRMFEKVMEGTIVVGLTLVFGSVVWEQYRARRSDPYRRVRR